MSLFIPVSAGELLDKKTILLIKKQRITNEPKLENITRELNALERVVSDHIPLSKELKTLTSTLYKVNEKLWDIEDEIRECERHGDFGKRFIELARSVYRTNDQRAEVKYRINELLGSELREEKSYQAY